MGSNESLLSASEHRKRNSVTAKAVKRGVEMSRVSCLEMKTQAAESNCRANPQRVPAVRSWDTEGWLGSSALLETNEML